MIKVILAQDEYLTIAEAAQALGVGQATVYRWLKSGKFQSVRVARTLIPRSEVDKIFFTRKLWSRKLTDAFANSAVMEPLVDKVIRVSKGEEKGSASFHIGFIRPVTGCVLGKKKKEEKEEKDGNTEVTEV